MTCPKTHPHHPESCSTRHLGPRTVWTLSKGLKKPYTRYDLCTSVLLQVQIRCGMHGSSLGAAAASQLPVCECASARTLTSLFPLVVSSSYLGSLPMARSRVHEPSLVLYFPRASVLCWESRSTPAPLRSGQRYRLLLFSLFPSMDDLHHQRKRGGKSPARGAWWVPLQMLNLPTTLGPSFQGLVQRSVTRLSVYGVHLHTTLYTPPGPQSPVPRSI
ncbi:hypothetical protein V8F06_011789 [Rhypophila decipiens]